MFFIVVLSSLKDAVPLYEQLQYDPMYRAAIECVFGGRLVCRDMEKASQISKTAEMDCITLDGENGRERGVKNMPSVHVHNMQVLQLCMIQVCSL